MDDELPLARHRPFSSGSSTGGFGQLRPDGGTTEIARKRTFGGMIAGNRGLDGLSM